MPVGDFIFRLKCIGAVLEMLAVIADVILALVLALFSFRLDFMYNREDNAKQN